MRQPLLVPAPVLIIRARREADPATFIAPHGAENVALIVAKHAGPIIVGGLGAGRAPTASAIIADLHDIFAHMTITTNPQKKETTHA